MSEAKPTPGECWVDAHMNVISSAGLVAFPGCTAGFDQKKNAHLIAEAFNAYNTTGLTPSQLVERVKELEELLAVFVRLCPTDIEMRRNGWGDEAVADLATAYDKARALSKARPNTAEGEAAQQAPAGAALFDEQGFREWVLRNLPDDTIIGNSAWWADHLTAWAKRFVKATTTPPAAKEPSP